MENKTFESLVAEPLLKKALTEINIHEPTPVQERAIPFIKDSYDVICQSSTGSGKTLAFILPIAERIDFSEKVQVLVLVPTRELCEQVAEEFRKVTRYTRINVLQVYGGVSIEEQIKRVPQAHIVIATPGRLCDLLQRKAIRLDGIKTVILDEADRMLDMGFIRDVELILRTTPKKRQTLMFSATLPKGIHHIIHRHMQDPKVIKTKEHVDKNLLKQYYYDVPIRDRFHLLVHLLRQEKTPYALVFCGTRRAVDLIAHNLNKNGINASAIHGGLTQSMRKRVMSSFHGKDTHVLVASDIAARGIDIKMLGHVYNFDVPKTPEEYTHRIGRTARAGEEGIAITLVSEKDYDNFHRVLRDPSLKIEKLPLPKFETISFDSFVQRRPSSRPQHSGRRYSPRFKQRRRPRYN